MSVQDCSRALSQVAFHSLNDNPGNMRPFARYSVLAGLHIICTYVFCQTLAELSVPL